MKSVDHLTISVPSMKITHDSGFIYFAVETIDPVLGDVSVISRSVKQSDYPSFYDAMKAGARKMAREYEWIIEDVFHNRFGGTPLANH